MTQRGGRIGTTIYTEDESLSITDTYATKFTINSRNIKDSVIAIKNDDGSATLSYRIFGSLKDQDAAPVDNDDSWINLHVSLDSDDLDDKDPTNYSDTRERTIPTSGRFYESFNNKWGWVKVEMKSSTGTITGKIWHRGTS